MPSELAASLPDWTVRSVGPNSSFSANQETPIWVDEMGSLTLSRINDHADGDYRLRLADQIAVDINFDRRLVKERMHGASVAESTRRHFLVDQVLPRILGQNGELVLHAAALRVNNGAVLLIGQSGSGKSTLSASFDQAGYPLLGDDAVMVSWKDEFACAKAVYPSLRLFPDSIAALCLDGAPSASIAHYSPKLRLDVPVRHGGEGGACRILALFVLAAGSPSPDIGLRTKSIAAACMALVENSFVLDPTDTARAPARLHQASKLAREVPAFDLSFPRAYFRLADVRAAILQALD